MPGRKRQIPEAVSVPLAAAILDVHTRTIRRWVHSGHLIGYRVGPKIIRIPRSEIARLRSVRIYDQDRLPR